MTIFQRVSNASMGTEGEGRRVSRRGVDLTAGYMYCLLVPPQSQRNYGPKRSSDKVSWKGKSSEAEQLVGHSPF